ncbi:MAG: hypothetical protein ACI84C_001114, partial [Flavobacteriales bacterium]
MQLHIICTQYIGTLLTTTNEIVIRNGVIHIVLRI